MSMACGVGSPPMYWNTFPLIARWNFKMFVSHFEIRRSKTTKLLFRCSHWDNIYQILGLALFKKKILTYNDLLNISLVGGQS